MEKRGIAPLFVSVTLVVLSVVLGGLIYTYLYTYSILEDNQNAFIPVDCTRVSLDYEEACLYLGSIRLDLTNSGENPVTKLMSFLTSGGEITSKRFGNGPGIKEGSKIHFDYDPLLSYEQVYVYPILNVSGEFLSCPGQKIDLGKLDNCSYIPQGSCGDGVLGYNQWGDLEICDPGLDSEFEFEEDVFSCAERSEGDLLSGCAENCTLCLYRDRTGGSSGPDEPPIVIPPITLNFTVDSAIKDDFWYPLVVSVTNIGERTIEGFRVVLNGTTGNDEYIHRHRVYSGESGDINVFFSAEVGDINSLTLYPGLKNISENGSLSWDWYDHFNESFSGVVDNSDWTNVLGYWNFKESEGNFAYDNSPRGKVCAVNPSQVGAWRNDKYCIYGRCYYMDGAHEGLNCSYDSYFDDSVSYGLTVEAVIRPWRVQSGDGEIKDRLIASKYYADSNGSRSWLFRLDNDTQDVLFRIYRPSASGDSWRTVEPDPSLYQGNFTVGAVWHHLVGWYNGSLARLYVDGRKVGERDWGTTSYPINPSPGVDIMIGDWIYWSGDTFNGRIESVTIYNDSISENLILKHARDIYSLADCPRQKRTREPEFCDHQEFFGVNNSADISQPSGRYFIEDGTYYGFREYLNFSNSGNCDVAIMAVHGGGTEFGTEQISRYIYEQLSSQGYDVGLWVSGARNTNCSYCSEGCEKYCHHVTSGAMEPECDPYLKEILTRCKTGFTLHGCDSGCRPTINTSDLPPVLIGGRSDYELKDLLYNYSNESLGDKFFWVNFDDVQDCKFFFDNVSCYRGADHCNIVNQFPHYNYLEGLPGIQLEMPPGLRANTSVSRTNEECEVQDPPEDCFTRFENENLWGDTKIAADSYIEALKDYIAFKGW